uniref:Uncharacterized protein n=1 Tax=Spongospora subterranea TaxID=70186 RepID=A0A0H5QIC0_9EUKA|eukprot:CRZ01753.1 hypothetical protein [Spongospora subterranea]
MFAVALFVFAAFFIYMKCHYAHLPGISIEKLQATVATVALILFLYFGGTSLWSALVLSLFATAVHAVFYVPKMKSTTIGVKELWKNSDSVFAKFGDLFFKGV